MSERGKYGEYVDEVRRFEAVCGSTGCALSKFAAAVDRRRRRHARNVAPLRINGGEYARRRSARKAKR